MKSFLFVVVILLASVTTMEAADSSAAWTIIDSMKVVVYHGFPWGEIDTVGVEILSCENVIDSEEALNYFDSIGYESVETKEFESFSYQVVQEKNNLIKKLKEERRGFLRIVTILSNRKSLLMDFDEHAAEPELFQSDLELWAGSVLFLVKKKD